MKNFFTKLFVMIVVLAAGAFVSAAADNHSFNGEPGSGVSSDIATLKGKVYTLKTNLEVSGQDSVYPGVTLVVPKDKHISFSSGGSFTNLGVVDLSDVADGDSALRLTNAAAGSIINKGVIIVSTAAKTINSAAFEALLTATTIDDVPGTLGALVITQKGKTPNTGDWDRVPRMEIWGKTTWTADHQKVLESFDTLTVYNADDGEISRPSGRGPNLYLKTAQSVGSSTSAAALLTVGSEPLTLPKGVKMYVNTSPYGATEESAGQDLGFASFVVASGGVLTVKAGAAIEFPTILPVSDYAIETWLVKPSQVAQGGRLVIDAAIGNEEDVDYVAAGKLTIGDAFLEVHGTLENNGEIELNGSVGYYGISGNGAKKMQGTKDGPKRRAGNLMVKGGGQDATSRGLLLNTGIINLTDSGTLMIDSVVFVDKDDPTKIVGRSYGNIYSTGEIYAKSNWGNFVVNDRNEGKPVKGFTLRGAAVYLDWKEEKSIYMFGSENVWNAKWQNYLDSLNNLATPGGDRPYALAIYHGSTLTVSPEQELRIDMLYRKDGSAKSTYLYVGDAKDDWYELLYKDGATGITDAASLDSFAFQSGKLIVQEGATVKLHNWSASTAYDNMKDWTNGVVEANGTIENHGTILLDSGSVLLCPGATVINTGRIEIPVTAQRGPSSYIYRYPQVINQGAKINSLDGLILATYSGVNGSGANGELGVDDNDDKKLASITYTNRGDGFNWANSAQLNGIVYYSANERFDIFGQGFEGYKADSVVWTAKWQGEQLLGGSPEFIFGDKSDTLYIPEGDTLTVPDGSKLTVNFGSDDYFDINNAIVGEGSGAFIDAYGIFHGGVSAVANVTRYGFFGSGSTLDVYADQPSRIVDWTNFTQRQFGTIEDYYYDGDSIVGTNRAAYNRMNIGRTLADSLVHLNITQTPLQIQYRDIVYDYGELTDGTIRDHGTLNLSSRNFAQWHNVSIGNTSGTLNFQLDKEWATANATQRWNYDLLFNNAVTDNSIFTEEDATKLRADKAFGVDPDRPWESVAEPEAFLLTHATHFTYNTPSSGIDSGTIRFDGVLATRTDKPNSDGDVVTKGRYGYWEGFNLTNYEFKFDTEEPWNAELEAFVVDYVTPLDLSKHLTVHPKGTDVAWESSDPTIAEINATTGVVTGKYSGTAVITVRPNGGEAYAATVNVRVLGAVNNVDILESASGFVQDANEAWTLEGFRTITLKAQTDPAGEVVAWSEAEPASGFVTIAGAQLTSHSLGKVTLVATAGANDKTDTLEFTVVEAGLVSLDILDADGKPVAANATKINIGDTSAFSVRFNPVYTTDTVVEWTVEPDGIVSIVATDNRFITLTGVTGGTVNLKVSGTGGKTANINIAVQTAAIENVYVTDEAGEQVSNFILSAGQTKQLTAVVLPAIAPQEVEWASDNEAVATVDATGLVTAVAAGNTNVSATASNGMKVTVGVQVEPAVVPAGVTILEGNFTLEVGADTTLTIDVVAGSFTIVDTLWASDNAIVANVDNTGKVTAVSAGTANISVQVGYEADSIDAETGETVTYTAYSAPFTATVTVTVVEYIPNPATGVEIWIENVEGSLEPDSVGTIILEADSTDETATLGLWAKVLPEGADDVYDYEWSVSNKEVASVVTSGEKGEYADVTISKGKGTVEIYARVRTTTLGKEFYDTLIVNYDVNSHAEVVGDGNVNAYFYNGALYINSSVSEVVSVYSIDGAKLFSIAKPAGEISVNLSAKGVLIVRGQSGWTQKVVR